MHLKTFYDIRVVNTVTELYYITQIGKHLHEYYNDTLDLSGVVFDERVVNTLIGNSLKFAIKRGDIINCNVKFDSEIIVTGKNNTWENILITEIPFDELPIEQPSPDSLGSPRMISVRLNWNTDCDEVIFSHICDEYDSQNINNLNKHINNSMRFISLISYVAVKRVMEYPKLKFEIIAKDGYVSYILHPYILIERSSAIDKWVTINKSNLSVKDTKELGCDAWYRIGEDMGYFDDNAYPDGIPNDTKLEYLQKMDLQVGDVVLLIHRKAGQKTSPVKPIDGVTVGILKEINTNTEFVDSGISVDVIGTLQTKYIRQQEYNNSSETQKMSYPPTYSPTDGRLISEKYNWADIGIDYCSLLELDILTTLQKGTYATITDMIAGKKVSVHTDIFEYVYWICKDYGFKFNEERYKERYLPFSIPLYERFISGELQ